MTNYNYLHQKHREREGELKGSFVSFERDFYASQRDLFLDAQMIYDGLQTLPVAEPKRTLDLAKDSKWDTTGKKWPKPDTNDT